MHQYTTALPVLAHESHFLFFKPPTIVRKKGREVCCGEQISSLSRMRQSSDAHVDACVRLAHRLDGYAELPFGVEDLEQLQPGAQVVRREFRPGGGEPRVLARLARRDSSVGVHGQQLSDEVLNKVRIRTTEATGKKAKSMHAGGKPVR